jgi:predicted GNAT family acetyltransferase
MHEVTDAPDRSRYELLVDGEVVGHVRYRWDGDVLDLLHTEIDDGHEGEGLGGALARGVLDDARRRGLRVRPSCPFLAGWIAKHPDYAELVTT